MPQRLYAMARIRGTRAYKKDIAENLHVTMVKQGLYGLRPEYYENFPLKDFRDKIYQEVRTTKYLHTINVKGKRHKAS